MQGAQYKLVCLTKNSSNGEYPVPPTVTSHHFSMICDPFFENSEL